VELGLLGHDLTLATPAQQQEDTGVVVEEPADLIPTSHPEVVDQWMALADLQGKDGSPRAAIAL
jgi:hypothetical protein